MVEEEKTIVEEDSIGFKKLPSGKPHISFSELANWNNCTYSHYLKQIKGIIEDVESIYLTFGTAVHAAIEQFFKTGKMDSSVAEKLLKDAYERLGEDEKFTRGIKLADVIEQAQRILSEFPKFLDDNFPGWKFIATEHKIYEAIESKPEHAFKGYVDLIISAPDKKGKLLIWVLDLKTTTSFWRREKKQDPMVKAQLVFYKHHLSKMLNVPLKDMRCSFLLLKRQAKPGQSIERFDVSVGDVTIKRTLKVVDNMITTMKRGIAIKDRTACDWCEFRNTEHCTWPKYNGQQR